MPIYEYLCESCGKLHEVMQKVSDPPPAKCQECGSRRLAKLMSRTAFQLKGGGWYADLYGTPRKKEGGPEASSAGAGAEPAAGAERKTEAEPKGEKDHAPKAPGTDKPGERKPARKAGKARGG